MLRLKNLTFALCLVAGGAVQAADSPKYIFYMIGDGMSSAQRQISEYYARQQRQEPDYRLAINAMPISGIITTQSNNSLVTDSAAAGTALATGVKTNNGMLGLTPDGKQLTTLLQGAQKQGKATGLITSTRLTHATPAAFIAKNINRNAEAEIAVDFLNAGVDFLAGGGYRNFISGMGSKRSDQRNLVEEFSGKGYHTFIGEAQTEDFLKYQPTTNQPVLAMFTPSHMPYAIDHIADQTPSLAQMTARGIEHLSRDDDGFFVMIEGGRIDHAAHANDVAGVIGDTLAFDDAVKQAVAFYHKHPEETLIVVVGDHETGGMGLGMGKQYFINLDKVSGFRESIDDKLEGVYQGDRPSFYRHIAAQFSLHKLSNEEKATLDKAMDFVDAGKQDKAKIWGGYDPVAIAVAHITSRRTGIYWTSYAHTASQLPLSAMGVGASRFGGFTDNTEVAKTLASIMGVEIGLQ